MFLTQSLKNNAMIRNGRKWRPKTKK